MQLDVARELQGRGWLCAELTRTAACYDATLALSLFPDSRISARHSFLRCDEAARQSCHSPAGEPERDTRLRRDTLVAPYSFAEANVRKLYALAFLKSLGSN